MSPALCEFLAARLNDGWAPVVPARGITSAGEVDRAQPPVPDARRRGARASRTAPRSPRREALARRGVAPYEPGVKEGIALVNGAPLAPALAASLDGARAGACSTTRRSPARSPRRSIGALAAAVLARASARSRATRASSASTPRCSRCTPAPPTGRTGPQAPVSLRVLPQVHGAALDLLDHVDAQVARELRAVTDSPLYLDADGDEPEGLYPSGNFHAQALSLGLDALAIAFAQVGNLGEKRLHRLLDHRFSGLPDQLAADPGRQTGLVFLHKSAIGYAAENRTAGRARRACTRSTARRGRRTSRRSRSSPPRSSSGSSTTSS